MPLDSGCLIEKARRRTRRAFDEQASGRLATSASATGGAVALHASAALGAAARADHREAAVEARLVVALLHLGRALLLRRGVGERGGEHENGGDCEANLEHGVSPMTGCAPCNTCLYYTSTGKSCQ